MSDAFTAASHPVTPASPARPGPFERRSTAGRLALGLILLATAAGCGRADDLIGTGPIRAAAPAPDGTVFVLRAWRPRTPNSAVLLTVDARTGAAAPILPKFPGRSGSSIRTIEIAVPRPAREGGAGAPDAPDAPPTELIITGPELGVARLPGPFSYLGAFPEAEVVHEGRFLPPAGGPAAARSPDGRALLLFEPAATPDGPTAWTPVVVDLDDLSLARATGTRPDRSGRWIAEATIQLEGDTHLVIDGDGGLVSAPANDLTDVPAVMDAPWSYDSDRSSFTCIRVGRPDVTVPVTGGIDGFVTVAAPESTGVLAWTNDSMTSITLGSDGVPSVVPITLRFDRAR